MPVVQGISRMRSPCAGDKAWDASNVDLCKIAEIKLVQIQGDMWGQHVHCGRALQGQQAPIVMDMHVNLSALSLKEINTRLACPHGVKTVALTS